MVDVIAERQDVHPGALEAICASVAAELGAAVRLRWCEESSLLAELAEPGTGTLIVIPGAGAPRLDALFAARWPARRVVRVDLGTRPADASPRLAQHIQARGIEGLRWAVRSAVHQDRRPPLRHAYGADDPEQFGELHVPTGRHGGPFPTVVTIHGGYWRSKWQLELMDAMAVDLAEHGLACWNIEFRRPDRHGWAATTADVEAAVAHLAVLAGSHPLDLARVVVVGHSAGGQLGLRLCADLSAAGGRAAVRPVGCVSLAGVLDMVATGQRQLGDNAAELALGAPPDAALDRYLESSPMHRLPIGVPTVVVTGRADSNTDLDEMARRYVPAARAAGDEVVELEGDGGHFAVIDPTTSVWAATRQEILRLVV